MVRTIDIDGTSLPLTSDVGEFREIAASARACVMVINTKNFLMTNERLFGRRYPPRGLEIMIPAILPGQSVESG